MIRLFFILPVLMNIVYADVPHQTSQNNNQILWIAILLIAAIISLVAKKYRQNVVLGQIIIGAVIGTFAHFHFAFFAKIIESQEIELIAGLGSIFLLFEIGLESNFHEIKNAGKHALIVAALGVTIPFCLGYFVVTPYIIGSNSQNLALFIGGILAVTSTSISISVFKEFGIMKNEACQIVLAASVIDDIIGLILLSVIAALASSGYIDQQLIIVDIMKILIFFSVSYLLAKFILPKILLAGISNLGTGTDISTLFMVALCLIMSWFADIVGLANIIGAFIAGLILDYNHFLDKGILTKTNHVSKEHNKPLLDLILPLGKILTPIFFIYAGMQVDLINAFNIKTILTACGVSIFAIAGKLCCSIPLPKHINRLIIGFGMVPRGEIGIIFAVTGLNLGIINNDLFTALLLVVVITSTVTPIALNRIIDKKKHR